MIATILLVAITVVLAAVLYVLVTSIIPPGPPPGHVEMTRDSVSPGIWELRIASTTSAEDLFDYKVVILKNRTRVHIMDPLEEIDAGDYQFTDLDGGGTLSAGDRFYITCEPESLYELSVIWKDSGDERGSVEWES
ncbi:MAG: archaellin/type IV pilin N-terminal domain-containing protein [Thermoplasmata archaeon]